MKNSEKGKDRKQIRGGGEVTTKKHKGIHCGNGNSL